MFETHDYKAVIKAKAKELKKTTHSFSLRKLAHRIPIQYTYLSKILNDENTHLNEDQCYRAAVELGFEGSEVDMLLLLRAYQSTKDTERKLRLKQKVEVLIDSQQTKAEQEAQTQASMKAEMDFWLDPYCLIVKSALRISRYQVHPRLLCVDLGLSEARLKRILRVLEDNELITTHSEDPFRITEVKELHTQLGKNKPLMRTHQTVMKSIIPERLNTTEESDKHSFLATVNLSERDFDAVKAEFQGFLKKVEGIFKNSTHGNVYQINFDFFKWL